MHGGTAFKFILIQARKALRYIHRKLNDTNYPASVGDIMVHNWNAGDNITVHN
jgi:hypothetical protein